MPYFIEDTKDFSIYRIEGFFSFQDMEGLVAHFDKLTESNPNAKILMDFSAQTGYEEATIKAAFNRADQGFPRGVQIALVYEGGGGIYSHVLKLIAKNMSDNSQFFTSRSEAITWLTS